MPAAPRLILSLTALLATLALAPAPRAQDDDQLVKLEREFEAARDAYLELLGKELPDAYQAHFARLSKSELVQVASARRLWHWYIEKGPFTMGDPRKQSTGIFRREFLDPMEKVAELLLLDPAKLKGTELRKARKNAFAVADRLQATRERAGVGVDPTENKTAPTGIAIPHLDNPHTCAEVLELYEQTMVLAKTVGHPEAEDALMQNAAACAEVDRVEAQFVMYGNRMRTLSGSITWVCDPLMTACCRDHSNDRKNGDASGHQGKLEGKKWPADRARRFGCRSGPEGAGGGSTGRDAIRGFSYNGTGHGGPLYAMLRNVVGPGQRQGALTAMYQTDNRLEHACAATEGELVLPPGVTAKMLGTPTLRSAFKAMARGDYGKAATLLEARKPKDAFDKAIHEYLQARVVVEIEWTLTAVERMIAVGDIYEADERLQTAILDMEGIPVFDKRAGRLDKRLSTKGAVREIKIGSVYQRIIGQKRLDKDLLRRFIEEYPDSPYAEAAKHCLAAGNGAFWPELFYFVMQDTHLNKWSYLQKDRVGGRN